MKKIIIVLMLYIMIASCAPQQKSEFPADKEVVEPKSVDLLELPTAENQNDTPVVIPSPRQRSSEAKLIYLVSLDLSKRLGIDISKVGLINSTPVTWENGSLGCPAEGKSYSQEERSGFLIIVGARNVEYTYHSDGLEKFIWCNGNIPVQPLDETNQPFP